MKKLNIKIEMVLRGTETLIYNELLNGHKPDSLFHQKRELLGFEIGWLKPGYHQHVCELAGVNPETCEVVLMHAHTLTECHMHQKGASTFLVLGENHGFKNPNGGILTTPFIEGKKKFMLSDNKAFEGQIVEVPAGQIHSFYANEYNGLSALGFVYPKIKTGENEFDAHEFKFTENKNEVQTFN